MEAVPFIDVSFQTWMVSITSQVKLLMRGTCPGKESNGENVGHRIKWTTVKLRVDSNHTFPFQGLKLELIWYYHTGRPWTLRVLGEESSCKLEEAHAIKSTCTES